MGWGGMGWGGMGLDGVRSGGMGWDEKSGVRCGESVEW